jgi:proline-specific peptidase
VSRRVGWNALVYNIMWGPSEFLIDGHLRDWEAVSRLHLVKVPTLVTSGRFDAATPPHMKLLTDGIADSRSVVFDESAHRAHIEEPVRYRDALSVFFAAHDRKSGY